jgi:hypothetical protein
MWALGCIFTIKKRDFSVNVSKQKSNYFCVHVFNIWKTDLALKTVGHVGNKNFVRLLVGHRRGQRPRLRAASCPQRRSETSAEVDFFQT